MLHRFTESGDFPLLPLRGHEQVDQLRLEMAAVLRGRRVRAQVRG